MRIRVVLVLSLIVARAASAGSYTITTTARQDSILTWKLARVNEERTASGQATLTMEQLITAIVAQRIDEAGVEWRTRVFRKVHNWDQLTDADRSAICSRVGEAECPPR